MALPSPKTLLDRFGLQAKYSFGQNFLSDANLVARIAKESAPSGPCRVLELGAGLGALTDQLLERGCDVVAIERDRELIPCLGELFASQVEQKKLQLVEADAKTADWEGFLAASGPLDSQPGKVERVISGNLPYQITGPLIERAVKLAHHVDRAVFLVQKEVADRLAARPSTKAYGALSVFVQASFDVRRAFVIKGGAFFPPPRVESAVVVLTPREARIDETKGFQRLVKAAFASRRKTLRNNWKSIATVEQLEAACEQAGVQLSQRGETLGVEQFATIARLLESP